MIMNIIAAEAITTLLQPDRQGHPEEAFTPLSGKLTRQTKKVVAIILFCET